MTRINVVDVKTLVAKHLMAEYYELPRVFALAQAAQWRAAAGKEWRHNQPKHYTLGKGHLLFFYDKLGFLARRQADLVQEILRRGYKPNFTGCLREAWQREIQEDYWQDYIPTPEAIDLNQKRIEERLKGMKS